MGHGGQSAAGASTQRTPCLPDTGPGPVESRGTLEPHCGRDAVRARPHLKPRGDGRVALWTRMSSGSPVGSFLPAFHQEVSSELPMTAQVLETPKVRVSGCGQPCRGEPASFWLFSQLFFSRNSFEREIKTSGFGLRYLSGGRGGTLGRTLMFCVPGFT